MPMTQLCSSQAHCRRFSISCRVQGWGGIEVRNLPQFTAILPQFFSNASIQKFQFSPEEKSFSPFAVTRHTVCFCVLMCPTCRLCGRTLFCFCVPKMSSTSGDGDCGNGKRPVKRGKRQGGQKGGALCMPCAEIANWVRNWSNKPFCKKSCAPLLLMAGIESGDQKEMYHNFYRNYTAFFRNFPQFYRNFSWLGGPPVQGSCWRSTERSQVNR